MGFASFLHLPVFVSRFSSTRTFSRLDTSTQAANVPQKSPPHSIKLQNLGQFNSDLENSEYSSIGNSDAALNFKFENNRIQSKSPPSTRRDHLKVRHMLESTNGNSHLVRIVISGRMVDVCAELEKLALKEKN